MADIREKPDLGAGNFRWACLTLGGRRTRLRLGSVAAIRRAQVSEAPQAVSILREAARWLEMGGQKLWDSDEIDPGLVAQRARQGELIMGFEDGAAVACMYLQRDDPVFWPEAQAADALYVHRLAVRRAFARRGWGPRLLDWAALEAHKLRRAFLRLDTEPRPALLRLYANAGFRRVDEQPIRLGRHEVVRFERTSGLRRT